MSLDGAFRNHLTDFLKIDQQCDAQSLERGQTRERLSAIHVGERSANPTVKFNWLIVHPCLSRKELKNFQNRCIPAPFFGIFLFLPILRGVHGSGEFKDCQAFTFLMDGVAVGAEVQKCGDRGLELLVSERSNLVHCINSWLSSNTRNPFFGLLHQASQPKHQFSRSARRSPSPTSGRAAKGSGGLMPCTIASMRLCTLPSACGWL